MRAIRVGADQPRRYNDRRPCPRCGIERSTHSSRTGLCRDCLTITNPSKETQ